MERACKKKQEIAANKVKEAREKRDQLKAKLVKLAKELKELMERASKQCMTMQEEETVDCTESEEEVSNATTTVEKLTAVVAVHQARLNKALSTLRAAVTKNCDRLCKPSKYMQINV